MSTRPPLTEILANAFMWEPTPDGDYRVTLGVWDWEWMGRGRSSVHYQVTIDELAALHPQLPHYIARCFALPSSRPGRTTPRVSGEAVYAQWHHLTQPALPCPPQSSTSLAHVAAYRCLIQDPNGQWYAYVAMYDVAAVDGDGAPTTCAGDVTRTAERTLLVSTDWLNQTFPDWHARLALADALELEDNETRHAWIFYGEQPVAAAALPDGLVT